MRPRHRSGRSAYASGLAAEDLVCAALTADGWTILGRRLRTAAGEVDAVAEKSGLLAVVEVKHRPNLADAAVALAPRQQARLLAATDILLAEHPEWGAAGVRFDLLLVDATGAVRRMADAFRG
ncbi:MAG: YraN family protein [Proteobacteria bacterium]|nr:YraN family protein [Pseudomonadota bacterium]